VTSVDTDITVDDAVLPETDTDDGHDPQQHPKANAGSRVSWPRVVVFGVLPVIVFGAAAAVGYFKWLDGTAHDTDTARLESVQTAREAATALLSYQPGTADRQLGAARDLLTGTFKDSYTQLTHDVVIPGARQKHISAVASVPAAASVSADPRHAVVLVFIDQTVIVGDGAPTATSSAVRVAMDKIGGRWLISGFDPV
jgi:Mce-associated membrane protein